MRTQKMEAENSMVRYVNRLRTIYEEAEDGVRRGVV
jgi:hypothetical protein